MGQQIKIVKVDNVAIDENTLVKVKRMGNQTQLSHRWKVPKEMPFERISETEYLVKKTGEIKEYRKSKTRDEQIGELRKTFKKLREIINTNFTGQANEKFITLTYRENMQDVERLQRDFQIWMKSVRRKFGKCDYISIVKYQDRGAFCLQTVIKFYELENNYLDYDVIRSLWKHGIVLIDRLVKNKDIGLCITDNINNNAAYYPSAMKLYRRSKGIKDPVVYVTTKKDFIESIDDMELVNSSKYEVVSDGEVVNFTSYENYTMKK